ncbi:1-acyl-sn-glycerol-3-phosphate acyltransferase [Fodinibius roseus]|uniref:1-acyl-sn-glycerol-3-phosphate acyltransferase n=1 Tax=Fodinibius roseus TaxID=1194090 RepID=A0A1M4VZS1_9BACT|nr:lysophospholipid acyltransferase family protein [Fodinibius roseus]SHE74534.1 1-acyl-sn-glycerol-3-phosphate acyltransferase [Fodinibius roseus]
MSESTFSTIDYIRSMLAITAFFLIFLMAAPVILFFLVITLGKATNYIMETIAPLMVRPVLWFSGIRFNIERHAGTIPCPSVFIINHSSTLDVLTLLALGLPRIRFVAKWEFQYNPLFFLLGRLTGQIFIRRNQSEKAIAQLQEACKRIKEQQISVMMAPEGSRKHPGIIGPFKKGPFRMAMDLGYPVVPVYFEGSRELSPGGTLLTKSGIVTAHIHEPVDVSNWRLDDLEEHMTGIRRKYLQWAKADKEE